LNKNSLPVLKCEAPKELAAAQVNSIPLSRGFYDPALQGRNGTVPWANDPWANDPWALGFLPAETLSCALPNAESDFQASNRLSRLSKPAGETILKNEHEVSRWQSATRPGYHFAARGRNFLTGEASSRQTFDTESAFSPYCTSQNEERSSSLTSMAIGFANARITDHQPDFANIMIFGHVAGGIRRRKGRSIGLH
jgi:hypothetical protein